LDELVNLRLSRIDFPLGEMTDFGKRNKERKLPIGAQAKKVCSITFPKNAGSH